ncbi:MAG: NnrS family protein [Proteobacteria bacterium]|nr:NnrS family protein [Pseudomonadota bacterium]
MPESPAAAKSAPSPRVGYPALFGYGFRPFFLFVGVLGLLYIPWWVGSVAFGWQLSTDWPPTLWHGHEMLFGFIVAAIAGFMLTAVPNWTGSRGYAGWPLIGLAAVWTAGRLVILSSTIWPVALTAAVDLAFLPLLAFFIGGALLRARNRNMVLLLVLAALFTCNAFFHWGLGHHDAPMAAHALRAGIDVVLVLVTVIGGRIVPAFTTGAMSALGYSRPASRWPWVTPLVVAAMIANLMAGIAEVPSPVAATIAIAAAVLHAVRLVQWRAPLRLMAPIVWILHLAYGWLAVGFALKALALLGGYASAAFWLHALTIGAITGMVMAVMTRAALGHSGRPLVLAPSIAVAYLLLSAAALLRVFGLGALGLRYPLVLTLSGLLWLGALILYLVVYAPILLRPRADGRPG